MFQDDTELVCSNASMLSLDAKHMRSHPYRDMELSAIVMLAVGDIRQTALTSSRIPSNVSEYLLFHSIGEVK
jgi:hypothetical protein